MRAEVVVAWWQAQVQAQRVDYNQEEIMRRDEELGNIERTVSTATDTQTQHS